MEVQFPQKGDVVFREGTRACLMTTRRAFAMELGLMAAGYKEASNILIEYLDKNGRDDALVYPIIFGYRQYLELRIKSLTKLVNQFEETGEEFKRTHDLQRLWSKIRSRLVEELDGEDRDAFEAVEGVIQEFHKIDPKSDGFRFPSGIKQLYIDLPNMRDVMHRVSSFLDSLADIWEASIDSKF